MTVALIEPVTLTNVRTAAPELGPLVPTFDPYAYQRPHPGAVVDPRSALRIAWDDLGVRWLGYTGAVGVGLSMLAPSCVWWTLAPWMVAMVHNHRAWVSRRAAHRARRAL